MRAGIVGFLFKFVPVHDVWSRAATECVCVIVCVTLCRSVFVLMCVLRSVGVCLC